MSWPPRTRRVTMFKPILPRPTKPSCIAIILRSNVGADLRVRRDGRYTGRPHNSGFKLQQRIGDFTNQTPVGGRQMDVEGATARGIERGEVAERLRELQRVERKRLARNRKIDARSCRDQDE